MDQIKMNLSHRQVTVLGWVGSGRHSQEVRQNAQSIELAANGSEKTRLRDDSGEAGCQSTVESANPYFL